MPPVGYNKTVNILTDRILVLIKTNSEILLMESPYKLYGIRGFYCEDLQPSLAQAILALQKAKELFYKNLT